MSGKKELQHSLLIVSPSMQFVEIVKRTVKGSETVELKQNAAAARRSAAERYYDLILINAPLPDEFGAALCYDLSGMCSASILFTVPREQFEDALEQLSDSGILVLPKPFPKGRMDKAIRYLMAVQSRIHEAEQRALTLEDKLEEQRVVSRAKLLLISRDGLSEDEAHRLIGKKAMDRGVSRGCIARELLELE